MMQSEEKNISPFRQIKQQEMIQKDLSANVTLFMQVHQCPWGGPETRTYLYHHPLAGDNSVAKCCYHKGWRETLSMWFADLQLNG